MMHRRLRDLRRAANLTQVQLAERLGVHEITVSKIECGKVPALSLARIEGWAKACGHTAAVVFEPEAPAPDATEMSRR